MKKIGVLFSLILVIAFTTAFTPANNVSPKPPVVFSWSFDYSGDLGGLANCGFEITLRKWGSWDFTYYYDKDGYPTKLNWTAYSEKATFSANGKTVNAPTWGSIVVTYQRDGTGIAVYYGPSSLLILPKYGYVFGQNDLEVSNVTWSWDPNDPDNPTGFIWDFGSLIKQVGYYNFDHPNWTAICAYFAPNK